MTLASIFSPDSKSPPKSSARNIDSNITPIYDVETTLGASERPTTRGKRRYNVSAKGRRGSKWLPSPTPGENPLPSPSLTLNSGDESMTQFTFDDASVAGAARGLRPQEMEAGASVAQGRRPSVLLQKSLKETDHSPFSVWPSSSRVMGGENNVRRRSMAANVNFARRMSKLPRLAAHIEQ